MSDGEASAVRPRALEALGERYRRYRLSDPAAEEAMARSLQRYGQSAPVVVCLLHRGRAELTPSDRGLLSSPFTRLVRDTVVVTELVGDWLEEMHTS